MGWATASAVAMLLVLQKACLNCVRGHAACTLQEDSCASAVVQGIECVQLPVFQGHMKRRAPSSCLLPKVLCGAYVVCYLIRCVLPPQL